MVLEKSDEDSAVRRCAEKAATAARRVSSEELLGAAGELEIQHAGLCYRLRITSKGGLILTR